MSRVLILIDAITLPHLVSGQPPVAPFSHDRNLFQFAHEALRRGDVVLFTAAQGDARKRDNWRVRQIYPTWEQDREPVAFSELQPHIVVAVFPEALNIRSIFPHPKIVAIHAAIHWIESPERFSAQYVFDLITAVRYNIDFILTQNERMAEVLAVVYNLLAKWPMRDRILVAPLGIVEEERRTIPDRPGVRAEMGLEADDTAIINSGGVWRWTDFNTFLAAFGEHVETRAGDMARLKLFIMGLLQPSNDDHADYVAETERLLHRFSGQLGDTIVAFNDWADAGRRVKSYTAASDIGLNVNTATLENWQSYRLRALDYMYFGLPVINTTGDMLSAMAGGRHAFVVEAGDVRGYRDVIDAIAREPGVVAERSGAMRALAKDFDSRNTYGRALETIAATPRRPAGDHAGWGDCVLDYANGRAAEDFRARLRRGVTKLADDLLASA